MDRRGSAKSIILLGLIAMASMFTGTANAVSLLDSTFNPAVNRYVHAIAVQADGKILIGGEFTAVGGVARNRIARLNADGSLDTTFADPNANNIVSSIALQPDGKILIGGNFTTVGTPAEVRNRIARLNPDGALDTTFTDAIANSTVLSIAVQADGKILLGGDFTTISGAARNRIARLNSNGSLDMDFNPNANNPVSCIAQQPAGKILIGGEFTAVGGVARNRIVRLNADGSLDTTFADPDANNSVFAIALQADGNVLIGGSFNVVGGEPINAIARLDSNGTLDMGFNPFPNNLVYSIAVQADGKILVGGTFTTFGNQTLEQQNNFARLNAGLIFSPGAVKIEGDSRPFYAIDPTLVECTSPGKTVLVRNMDFAEEVIMAGPVDILLKGGYTDSAFTTQGVSSKTVINGSLKVRGGALRVERLSVRPGTINSDPVQYTLTANALGNGWGGVTSSSGGIGYTYPSANTGSAMIYSGDTVTLTATSANSTVAWSDGCSSSGGTTTEAICAITGMNALRTVTATFTANPATVKIEADDTMYYVIDSTLGSITTNKTVFTRDLVFAEDVIMESPVAILLKGGYMDNTFTTRGASTATVIDGSLKVRSGTLRVERLSLR